MERAKDIGLRKVAGSSQKELVYQFITESWLVNLTSVLLAVILMMLFKPLFNRIIGENIGLFILTQPKFWIFAIPFTFAVSFFQAFILHL